MPKPQGTYRQIQQHQRAQQSAKEDKRKVSTAKQQDLDEFYRALDRVSPSKLKSMHRDMAALSSFLKKNEHMSEDDKTRKKVSDALKEVRKIFEKVKDYRQLEGSLQAPMKDVIRSPTKPAGPDVLVAVIALFQVLEFLVRTVNRKK